MSAILVNDLRYLHRDREILFDNVTFSLRPGQKAALVGDNGSGKSTLVRILAGQLQPASGQVALDSTPYYIPQHFGQLAGQTLAGAMGAGEKLRALHAILAGDVSEENYATLADDWDIEERARAALAAWDMDAFALGRDMASLSGGEKTRVLLAGASLRSSRIILMDEPSNHLDAAARVRLYEFVRASTAAILIVSHDRTLLGLVDATYELSANGVAAYGGNYELYHAQKQAQSAAMQAEVHDQQKSLRAARDVARKAAERKQRMDARGERKQASEGVSRILMRTIKDGAEASAARLKDVHSGKIGRMEEELRDLRGRIGEQRELKVKFSDAGLHRGKRLVRAQGVNFAYGGGLGSAASGRAAMLWPEPLDLQIFSGERVAIKGGNGSGKTTLLRLILGELQPTAGIVERAAFSSVYIDQEYSLVDDRKTVVEQAMACNTRNLPEHEVKTELHRFLLPAAAWDKPCGALSGGEKMKLIFCCLLVGDSSPGMLVLDEPTNNLDIRSMEIVARALAGYRGTLLVISHDAAFLRSVGVQREITLP